MQQSFTLLVFESHLTENNIVLHVLVIVCSVTVGLAIDTFLMSIHISDSDWRITVFVAFYHLRSISMKLLTLYYTITLLVTDSPPVIR